MRCSSFISASAFAALACIQSPQMSLAFDSYKISDAAVHENLDVRFIHGTALGGQSPIALQKAMADGAAKIYATDDGAYIENVSGTPIFVGLGTLLKGGLQDQVVARSFVLPPRSGRVPLDIFCADPFRASARGNEDAKTYSVSGALFPWHVARLGMLSGTSETKAAKDLRGLEVWWSIDTLRTRLSHELGGALWPPRPALWKRANDERTEKLLAARRSPLITGLPLALESGGLGDAVRPFVDALVSAGERKDVTGAVFVVNGSIVGAEIYQSQRLFHQMWPQLLRAYAIEAIAARDSGQFTRTSIDRLQDFIREAESGSQRENGNPIVSVTRAGNADRQFLVRDGHAVIFSETRSVDGQWVNRSYLPKLDMEQPLRAPEDAIVSALEAGRVEGYPIASLGENAYVIPQRAPSGDRWSLTIQGVRPNPSPIGTALPRSLPQSRLQPTAIELAGALMLLTLGFLAIRPATGNDSIFGHVRRLKEMGFSGKRFKAHAASKCAAATAFVSNFVVTVQALPHSTRDRVLRSAYDFSGAFWPGQKAPFPRSGRQVAFVRTGWRQRRASAITAVGIEFKQSDPAYDRRSRGGRFAS
jgi:hypothetical protein